jgi:hypothetical protein
MKDKDLPLPTVQNVTPTALIDGRVTPTVLIDGREAHNGEDLDDNVVVSTQGGGSCTINVDGQVAAYVAGAKVVPKNDALGKDFENVYITVVKCEFPPSSALTKYLCGGQTFYELHTKAGSVRIRE